ncbi:MAG: hypothetical protein ACOC8N_10060, partial [Spirochaetota bacterium]
MRYALLLPVLAVPLWGFSCGIRMEREQEPNNTPAQATPVRAVKVVQGRLSGAQDRDFFVVSPKTRLFGGVLRITAGDGGAPGFPGDSPVGGGQREGEPGFLLRVQVTAPRGADLALGVYRGDDLVKRADDRQGGGEEGMERESFAAAYYTERQLRSGEAVVEVSAGGGFTAPADYELSVDLEPAARPVEREPNNRMVTATPLELDSAIQGYYSPAFFFREGDREPETDWYSFQVPRDGGQRVYHFSVSAVPDVDANIALYDELGYLIRRGDSAGTGEGEKLKNLGLEGGTYYVRVSGGRGQENSMVPYLLKVESGPVAGEREPNDRYTHATPLVFDQDTNGFINPSGDVDWYRLVLYETRRQVITAKVGPTAGIDPVLELYRGHDELLVRVDDRGRDEGEIIKNMGVREGIYYLRVSSGHAGEQNPNDPYT